jgi:hypothetical protein
VSRDPQPGDPGLPLMPGPRKITRGQRIFALVALMAFSAFVLASVAIPLLGAWLAR